MNKEKIKEQAQAMLAFANGDTLIQVHPDTKEESTIESIDDLDFKKFDYKIVKKPVRFRVAEYSGNRLVICYQHTADAAERGVLFVKWVSDWIEYQP